MDILPTQQDASLESLMALVFQALKQGHSPDETIPVGSVSLGQMPLSDRSLAPPDQTIQLPSSTLAPASVSSVVSLDALPPLRMRAYQGVLADLEIGDLLGEGGMGRVELAWQRSLGREVAVKTVRPDIEDPGAPDSLLKEAFFTGSLEHPNIIPVHQLGRDTRGSPVMVMKRVEGASWKEILEDAEHEHWERVSGDRLRYNIEILMQVCNVISFAHSRGVLHRDIKPSNVMLGRFGEVYLLDWGIAMHMGGVKQSAWLVGTPACMAPEMLAGDSRVSEQTDVYLLGATLHCILTGKPRHHGENLNEVLMTAFRSNPCAYPPSIPVELASLCNRACAQEKSRRPETAEAFRESLSSFLQHQSSQQLAEEAEAKWRSLQALQLGAEQQEAFMSLFAECRFGFEQALRLWPGSRAAQHGLQSCLELGIHRAIADENRGLAASLLSDLPRPHPELNRRLDALDDKLRQKEQAHQSLQNAHAELRQIEEEHDVTISGGLRAILAALAAFLTGLSALGWSAGNRLGIVTFDHQMSLLSGTLFMLGVLIGLFYWRRDLLKTTLNRHFAGLCTVFVVAVPINRLFIMLLDMPVRASLILDLLLGAVCLAMAVSADRRFMILSCVALIAAFTALMLPPGYELDVQGGSMLFGALILVALWRTSAQRSRQA